MMNNKNKLFQSKLFCKLYMNTFGAKNVKQGAYILDDLVRRFSTKKVLSDREVKKLAIEVAYNYAVYGFQTDEFFIYDVISLSDVGKRKFITEGLSRWYYYDKLNKSENTILFDDKSKTYELFKKYYGREVLTVKPGEGENLEGNFNAFCARYDSIIVKPLDSSGGKGVRLLKKGEPYSKLVSDFPDGFMVEPCLKNEKEFSEFHPSSLNTVRITTVRFDDRVEVAYAFARLGQGGSVIDNARSGGIIGLIDPETGIIIAACDEHMNRYIIHPDSRKKIIGFEIPMWREAVAFVTELCQVVPDNRYTGWDVVLTDSGWVMIEGNCKGQFVAQMPLREGLKPKFDEYIRELYGEGDE